MLATEVSGSGGRDRRVEALASIPLVGLPVLVAVVLAQSGSGYRPSTLFPAALFVVGIMLCLVAVASAGRRPFPSRSTAVLSIGAVAASWMLAATAALSIVWASDKQAGIDESVRGLIYAAALTLAWESHRRFGSATTLKRVLVGGGALTSVIAACDLYVGRAGVVHEGQLIARIGYHNAAGSLMCATALLALWAATDQRLRLPERIVAGGVVGLAAAMSIPLQSRGTAIACAAGLLVWALLSPVRFRGVALTLAVAAVIALQWHTLNGVYSAWNDDEVVAAALRHAVVRAVIVTVAVSAVAAALISILERVVPPRVALVVSRVALVVVVVALCGAVAVAISRAGAVSDRLDRMEREFRGSGGGQGSSRYVDVSNNGRLELWSTAVRAWKSEPLHGVGAGNWVYFYYEHRRRDAGWVRQPHNFPLEVLAERGLIGIVPLGVLAAALAAACVSGAWRHRDIRDADALACRGEIAAGAALTAAWAAQMQLEWFWQLPAVTLPVALVAGATCAQATVGERPQRADAVSPSRRAGRAVVACLLLVLLLPLGSQWIGDRWAARARSLDRAGSARSLTAIRHARSFRPHDAVIARQHAAIAERYGRQREADRAIRAQVRMAPLDWVAHDYAASYWKDRGRPKLAARESRRAHELNPLSTF